MILELTVKEITILGSQTGGTVDLTIHCDEDEVISQFDKTFLASAIEPNDYIAARLDELLNYVTKNHLTELFNSINDAELIAEMEQRGLTFTDEDDGK
jgi:hypothetical protein